MSDKVALDGILAYALCKKINSESNISTIKSVDFNDQKLVITMVDNSTFEAHLPNMLIHNNKCILDKLSLNENNQLLYDDILVCDLSETVKNIVLDVATNELVITFGNESLAKIPIEPIIKEIINELLFDTGISGSMFLYSIVSTIKDLYDIPNPKIGQTVIVEVDSTKGDQRSLYVYKEEKWLWVGALTKNRDFNKHPININTEAIGDITDAMIPNTIVRVNQLHNHNNKDLLDNLSENAYNELLYKDKKLSAIKVKDKENILFNDITSIKISNFLGKVNGNLLELKFDALSTDLNDMPKTHLHNKILVSNQVKNKYELKSIEEITDSKENYTTTILTSDWGSNEGLGYYRRVITHNLNSNNLIVAFYDIENNVKKTYDYTILNELEIAVKSDINDECRIVINCSQGTARNKGNNIIGSDHIHNNLHILNGFNQDKYGNLLYNGTRIFTNFNPLIYKRFWNKQLFQDLSLLIDYNNIFVEEDIRIILSSEIIIENKNNLTEDYETDKKNEIRLQIQEDEFIVLDALIKPQEIQKYIVGINPNTRIFVRGYFSANVLINYFDTSFVQTK